MIIKNGYASRNIPSADAYKSVYERRIAAKKAGDKTTANCLKLILNTTYGAQLNQFNDLYDPLMARSVCISGQLYLLELVCHLMKDIPDLVPVNLNTDGLMIEFDDSQYYKVTEIVTEWQKRTGFTLEEDIIDRYYAKDCNSYVEVSKDSIKKKGGYVVRGIAPAGAFNVNNNAVIVADAITEWFVSKTPPEDTINACTDVFKFQLIAKAGAKYKEAYHIQDGRKEPVQKVNRVYAAKDPRYGKLYKVHAESDMTAMIEMLPDRCKIDNTAVTDPNHTKIDEIDKQWYIDLARKRINDFYGIKPDKRHNPNQERMDLDMATVSAKTETPETMNVWTKLLHARMDFLEAGVKKTGKNMKLSYLFFELDDIVPVAMPIFKKWHLIPVVSFLSSGGTVGDLAQMHIVDCDDPDKQIVLSVPLKEIEPIISSTKGTEVTNAAQRMGSAITYYRRYLYMMALDIVEADEMEARTGSNVTAEDKPAPKPKPPVTPEKRQEIKQELTDANGNADPMLLDALKAACKKLAEAGYTEQVVAIATQTENFTRISKLECEALIKGIAEKLNKGE